jgi:hypothetical protein
MEPSGGTDIMDIWV